MNECLGSETLVDLVEGRVDDATFARAASHASSCTQCRELLSKLARGVTLEAATLRDRPKSAREPGDVAAVRPSRLEIGTRVGRYELVRLLGAGGMGYVYAARDPELERTVALKLLRPDVGGPDAQLQMQERLRLEAQAMAQLAHPNVVAVHDVGVYEDRVFVAMEYIEGKTLAHWLTEAPRTQRTILEAYTAAGRGLAAAHAAGLVHRDFKPENAMVGADGRVRVGDFGLARPFDKRVVRFAKRGELGATTPIDLTSTGVVMGTPLYMAPEQYRGDAADARTDQFSFCVALYAAIYGARPFTGDTFTELAASVVSGKVEPPPRRVRVPRRIRDAIRRGMALRPEDRWPSMDTLLAELAVPQRRWTWVATTAAATAVATVAIVVVATRSNDSAGESCERPYLAGVWDTARKAKIQAAFIATKVPYGEASALEVVRIGDRFADGFLRLRTGACNAHERGDLETDAYALEAICFALRKRDLDAIVDRLEKADPRIAAHAVDAMSTLIPVEVCNTREMQQLLVGPPDPATRQAINHVIGGLHALRAARALGDDTVNVAALVAQVKNIEAPGVRAEVLELAGAYAAQIADYKDARVWLAQAADDAAMGRHDLAEASALVNLIVVIGRDLGHREEADALRVRVETAVKRLHDHPEVELAWLQAEAVLDAGKGDLVVAHQKLTTAITLADRQYDGSDLRRIAPRQTMIDVLAQHGFARDTRQYVDSILAIRVILGPDHPGMGTALVALGDSLASDDVENAVKSYERAAAIAERALDSSGVADAIAHLAALQVRRGDLVASRLLYERAVHLDETTRRPAHPATIAHRSALAALYDLLDRRADASKLYARVLADQRVLYDHDDPRIIETAARVLAAKP